MKRYISCLLINMCCVVSLQARKFIINCSFSSSCPITIYAQGMTYYLTEARNTDTEGPAAVILYTEGNRDLEFSAYDKNGERITQIHRGNKTDSSGNIIYTRITLGGTIHWDRSSSSLDNGYGAPPYDNPQASNEYNAYNGNYNQNTLEDHAAEAAGRVVQNTLSHLQDKVDDLARRGPKIAGYPYLAISLGMSRVYGEFARLKVCFGSYGGYAVYGGVGKDWIFNGENKDCLAWHVGMGYYLSPGYDNEHEILLGINYAETPVCEGGSVNLDLGYTYHIPRLNNRLGIYVGAGVGGGNIKEAISSHGDVKAKFIWDVSVGISIKLFANKRSQSYGGTY